jgi:hypothetical protein
MRRMQESVWFIPEIQRLESILVPLLKEGFRQIWNEKIAIALTLLPAHHMIDHPAFSSRC